MWTTVPASLVIFYCSYNSAVYCLTGSRDASLTPHLSLFVHMSTSYCFPGVNVHFKCGYTLGIHLNLMYFSILCFCKHFCLPTVETFCEIITSDVSDNSNFIKINWIKS